MTLPATMTPVSAPAASAAAMTPSPAGPAWKRWSASHGIPTDAGPLSAKFITSEMSIVVRRALSATTYRMPLVMAAMKGSGFGLGVSPSVASPATTGRGPAVGVPIIAMTTAAIRNEIESTANANPVLVTAITAPAIGGPTIEDSCIVPWSRALPDGRRSGSRVRGRNACWAGR